MNLEVRPTFINKGEIVKRLISDYYITGDGQAPEFMICIGDDFTDEDMFRALNGSGVPDDHYFACKVGSAEKMTLARWHLEEAQDVVFSMAGLVGLVDVNGKLPGAPLLTRMSTSKSQKL